jgi:hypothetical protein
VTRRSCGDTPPGRLYLPAAISAALLLIACGVQGPPRPPRVEQPAPVTDLTVFQKGQSLELSFALPLLATDGERLSKPLEVEIFRLNGPAGNEASNTPAGLNLWLTLSAQDLARYQQGEKVFFPLTLSSEEFRQAERATCAFAVRTLTRGFRRRPVVSEPSNIVHTTVLDVPEPVKDLRVRATESALELSWSRPSRSLTGKPVSNLAGYRVYRSRTGKPGSFQLLSESTAPVYRDPNFEFGQTYSYKVAAVTREAERVAESEDSPLAEITPRDTFPPAAPRALSAIYAAEAVELVWTANAEPDLAGYNVYRREEGAPTQKMNREMLPTPIFRDSSVTAGHRYLYYVTALDLTNNESSPSEEVSVETQ